MEKINFNSQEYNYSLKLDGNELTFKLESIAQKDVYMDHFSLEKLKDINELFSLCTKLDECINKIKTFIKGNYYTAELKDNVFIFHFKSPPLFVFDIKLPLKKESSNLHYDSLPGEIKKIIDENRLILGIDYGTTFSNASIVIGNNKPIIIPNDLGQLSTPSYISFIDDKKYYVGDLAKLTPSFDKNTIYGIKRLLGRKYNESYYDKTIEEMKKNQDFIFDFNKDSQSDKIKIEINYEKGPRKIKKEFFPEQLCAMILKKIKSDSEYYLSMKIQKPIIIKNAVITVPAYFNQRQREAIKQSAKIIDLNVKRIINEPTSACLSYGYEKEENEKSNILIIDFGGGTLDITILNFIKDGGGIKCIIGSSNGHINLGGDDFDLELMKYCLKKQSLGDEIDKNLSKNIRLKRACENGKIELSKETETKINLENYQNSININTSITRDEFNDICKDLFDKFRNHLDKVTWNYREKISKILLIGGSTFIPKVREIISEMFPNIVINYKELDPLFSVSKGAAILGAKELDLDDKNLYLKDVTNFPLGVEELGGNMSIVVKKNEKIPFGERGIYKTVENNQTICQINIYEGEKQKVKDNLNLGKFYLKNLPKKPAGEAKIKIQFYIDEDSCFYVKAFDLSNENNQKSIKVEEPKLYNDEEMIKLKDVQKNMKELIIEDYNIYKYDIIQKQEYMNKSKNDEKIPNR